MNSKTKGNITLDSSALKQWQGMLRDEVALFAMPGAHHKVLLRQAHALHQGGVTRRLAGVSGRGVSLRGRVATRP